MLTATQVMFEERDRIREIVLKDVDKLLGEKVTILIDIGSVQIEAIAEIKKLTKII